MARCTNSKRFYDKRGSIECINNTSNPSDNIQDKNVIEVSEENTPPSSPSSIVSEMQVEDPTTILKKADSFESVHLDDTPREEKDGKEVDTPKQEEKE